MGLEASNSNFAFKRLILRLEEISRDIKEMKLDIKNLKTTQQTLDGSDFLHHCKMCNADNLDRDDLTLLGGTF